jgi:hypothetical protein
MPELSRFFGIAIALYYDEHAAPCFVALSGMHRVAVDIDTGATHGVFPPRALGLVLEWRPHHVEELRENWRLAGERRPLRGIAPLE